MVPHTRGWFHGTAYPGVVSWYRTPGVGVRGHPFASYCPSVGICCNVMICRYGSVCRPGGSWSIAVVCGGSQYRAAAKACAADTGSGVKAGKQTSLGWRCWATKIGVVSQPSRAPQPTAGCDAAGLKLKLTGFRLQFIQLGKLFSNVLLNSRWRMPFGRKLAYGKPSECLFNFAIPRAKARTSTGACSHRNMSHPHSRIDSYSAVKSRCVFP